MSKTLFFFLMPYVVSFGSVAVALWLCPEHATIVNIAAVVSYLIGWFEGRLS